MKRIHKTMREYRKSKKSSVIVFVALRVLITACMVGQIFRENWHNAVFCLFALLLLTVPVLLQKGLKITLPNTLEIIIFLFIFSGTVLGEIYNFYERFHNWDTMLHTMNGFLCAAIGFALIDLLNKNSKKIKLSPFYVAMAAFCFSMTVGVLWEFYEWGMDTFALVDMQKDRVVQTISSVMLDPLHANNPIVVEGIAQTVMYDANGAVLATIDGGTLDIGKIDTMEDLFVNFIGAFVFSVFGFFYVQGREKFKFATRFIPQKADAEGQDMRDAD